MSDKEERSDNPYANQGLQVKAEGPGTAVAISQVMAEVQAQVIMAKKYPREVLKAMDQILAECDIPEFAELALYNYPRGDTRIEGPSIRMAEVLARNWGNMLSGIKEISREGNNSQMMAYAWDLETNRMARREFFVAHVRDTKTGGKKAVTEERDIYEVGANAGSRRERACILAVIPGHVTQAAVNRVKKTLAVKVGDPVARAAVMLEAFEKEFKVTKAQVERRLRHRIEAISVAEILSLGHIYNALRDGFAGPEDYFDPEVTGDKTPPQSVAARAKAAAGAAMRKSPGRTGKEGSGARDGKQAEQAEKTQQNQIEDAPEDGSGIPDGL